MVKGLPIRAMHKGTCASRTGFALADVIVATVILGAALAVLIGLAGRAVSSQALGQELSNAAHLADEQLQLVLARGPDDYVRRFPVQGTCEAPFENYKFALSFAGGTSVGDPYKVSATITWNSGGGGAGRALTIDTLMAPRTGNPDGEVDPLRTPPTTIDRTLTQ